MSPKYHKMATSYCSNRLFEWIVAGIMLQIGFFTLVGPVIGYKSAQLSFIAFSERGLSHLQVGTIFFLFGALRMIALRLNGQWILGPHVRVICALIGMVIWGQLLYGIVAVTVRTGEIYLTVAIWNTLIFGEYVSIKRAILDIKRPPKVVATAE